jgi:hypothetical protein
MLQLRIVPYLVAVFAALVVGWPLISGDQSTQCGLLSSGVLAMLFVSMMHLGSSAGIGRWIWGVIAAVLSFCAPLAFAMCMSDQPHFWWLGVGVIFLCLSASIAWRSHREAQDNAT